MGVDEGLADLQAAALNAPRMSMEQLAAAMGKSRAAAESYRAGRSAMPPEARLGLSIFLSTKAHQMALLAEKLAATVE